MAQDQPLFIVGAPRSGTTLLRTLLNRHPRIALCDETYFFYYVYKRAGAFGDLSKSTNRSHLVDQYLVTDRIKRLELDEGKLQEALLDEGDSYAAFFASLLKFFARSKGKERWGEKTPDHALHVDTLLAWYPNCRIIHIIRDPRDVVASLLRMPWGAKSVLANSRRWVQCNEAAVRLQGCENYKTIQYEQLTKDPKSELTDICQFVGEEYSPDMLVPDKNATVHKWWFERAQGEITQDRLETWRQELTAQQVAMVEWVAGTYMRQFGYCTSQSQPSAGAIARARIGQFVDSLCFKIRRLPRLWYYWVQPTKLAAEESWLDRGT